MSIFKFGKFNIVRVVGSDLPYEGDTGMVINFRGNLLDGIEYYVQLKNAGLSDWFTGDELVRERTEQPAVASAAADGQWEYNELVDRNKELIAQRKALESELDSAKAERDRRRLRILHLRRALKEIETNSGDNNSVLDAKEALEQDRALASKETLQASAPPADCESEGGG